MATTLDGALVFCTCCYEHCGVRFGLDPQHEKSLRESHSRFFCPNGHGQSFVGKTEVERLRDELKEKDKLIESAHARALAESDRAAHAENSHRATRGHFTRLRKRIAKGVCPCCNRYFDNLHKHMQGRHPNFEK